MNDIRPSVYDATDTHEKYKSTAFSQRQPQLSESELENSTKLTEKASQYILVEKNPDLTRMEERKSVYNDNQIEERKVGRKLYDLRRYNTNNKLMSVTIRKKSTIAKLQFNQMYHT